MEHESDTGVALGILLIVGLIISFIPQYHKIIKSSSVEGISHWSQGFNNISCFCALFGTFMLDYHLFSNCHLDPYCGRDLLPFIQLLFIWICLLINYILYMVYYNNTYEYDKKEVRLVYGFFAFYVIVFIICVGLTTLVLVANWENWEKHGILFGEILNGLSSIITTVVWVPQIITTIKLRNIGSLSLLSLAIQVPGTLVTFIFQVYISHSSWFVGAPYMVSFIFQLVLLILGIIFELKKQKKWHNLYNLYANDDEDTQLILVNDTQFTPNPSFTEYDSI
jgi:uncharacterized protein with PQ loop repeat